MIDYREASERKLNNIIAENESYAYDNVIVAVCELKARKLAVDEAAIATFCDRHDLPGIDEAIDRFLAEHKVTSYQQYVENTKWNRKLAKPQKRAVAFKDKTDVIGIRDAGRGNSRDDANHARAGIRYLILFIAAFYFFNICISGTKAAGEESPYIAAILEMRFSFLALVGSMAVYKFIRAIIQQVQQR